MLGLYAWVLFVALGAAVLPVLLLMPSLPRRRALVRGLARAVLKLTRMRVTVRGFEHIVTPCIVVANHESYLDGVVLQAVLPTSFSFIIKREMASVPLAGTLLRRIGAEFVERQNRQRSAGDARRLMRNAAQGQALAFFPEGTFGAEIGLRRFHIGAFAAAARAHLPVLPIAIRGTRACLPPDHILPRPGPIDVQILNMIAVPPADNIAEEFERAPHMRDAARAALLAALHVPDLAARDLTAEVRADATQTLLERYARESAVRGYDTDPAQRAALGRLEALRTRVLAARPAGFLGRWTRRLTEPRARSAGRHGIYLYGAVGRGKTMLMDLFFDSLPEDQGQRRHFHHFMRDVHERLRSVRRRRAPLEAVARDLAAQLRVLCLDELYVSDIADAMILGALFEALLRQGVWLVITSNQAPADLYKDGLQRSRFLPTIALLEFELEQCPLAGELDYRLRQLQRAPIYLDSDASDSDARLRRLFAQLEGEQGDTRQALSILGRAVPVVRCRGDVAWFEFDVLCEGSRSQNDYAELAQEFRTIMLSHVPVFSAPEQDDAARRFIALVDEFYDQGTKLIVTAAAPPQELYRGDRLAAAFQRTASRLVEMQTAAYLARPRREQVIPN